MTTPQIITTILIVALTTLITRVAPFLVFPESKKIPEWAAYLDKVLPYAVIGMLVVFCFKDTVITAAPYGLPELIAGLAVVILYKLTKRMILTIGGGVIVYMILIQIIFVSK